MRGCGSTHSSRIPRRCRRAISRRFSRPWPTTRTPKRSSSSTSSLAAQRICPRSSASTSHSPRSGIRSSPRRRQRSSFRPRSRRRQFRLASGWSVRLLMSIRRSGGACSRRTPTNCSYHKARSRLSRKPRSCRRSSGTARRSVRSRPGCGAKFRPRWHPRSSAGWPGRGSRSARRSSWCGRRTSWRGRNRRPPRETRSGLRQCRY